jgi:hypothetical protein
VQQSDRDVLQQLRVIRLERQHALALQSHSLGVF